MLCNIVQIKLMSWPQITCNVFYTSFRGTCRPLRAPLIQLRLGASWRFLLPGLMKGLLKHGAIWAPRLRRFGSYKLGNYLNSVEAIRLDGRQHISCMPLNLNRYRSNENATNSVGKMIQRTNANKHRNQEKSKKKIIFVQLFLASTGAQGLAKSVRRPLKLQADMKLTGGGFNTSSCSRLIFRCLCIIVINF